MFFLQEYDETMDHLQSDIESLESEKGELREKLKALNKKTLYEALTKSSPFSGRVYLPFYASSYSIHVCVCTLVCVCVCV